MHCNNKSHIKGAQHMPLNTLQKLLQGQSVSMADFQIAADNADISHRAISRNSSYRVSFGKCRAHFSQHAETISTKSTPGLEDVIKAALA